MCHTMSMKKSLILLLPIAIFLTSCEKIVVGYTNGDHSAGLDRSLSGSTNSQPSYEYFSGDTFDDTSNQFFTLTFDYSKSYSNIAKEELAPLINSSEASYFNEAVASSYVGTKENINLFIGADSSYVDGSLTLSFNMLIQNVIITACPYYYESAGFEEKIVVDSDVAISVNDSRYIRLTTPLDNEGNLKEEESRFTECRYHLASESNEVTFKVGPKRAFIKSIKLFY